MVARQKNLEPATQREAKSRIRRKRRSPEEIMERLLNAAAEEFKNSGFAGATTAAIARKADVTEAQLFRYFPSKAALFNAAVVEPLNKRFLAFNESRLGLDPGLTDISTMAERYIDELQNFIHENADLFLSVLVAEAYEASSLEGINAIGGLKDYFATGAKEMRKRVGNDPTIEPELMVRASFAAVLGNILFKEWLYPKKLASQSTVRKAITRFVIEGINANNDPGLIKPAGKSKAR